MFMLTSTTFAQNENDVLQYIENYKNFAMEEQLRSGVPAAITLAQGIHETGAGQSELATQANNHFGIKCKTTWNGATFLHDDDRKQECFRKYASAHDSYIDHSNFLRGSNRYHFLFDLEITDYKGWASGLKRAGYATNPAYVTMLVNLVEKYNLQQYTFDAQTKKFETPVAEVVPDNDNLQANVAESNEMPSQYKGLNGFWAKKGEMLLDKAVANNIRYARLLALNDIEDGPLQYDMFVFTEKKRKTGTEEFHIVKNGENMQMISQKEAMLLSNLYAFNNLESGQEPEVGEKLALQYKAYDAPKLKPKFLSTLPSKIQNTPTNQEVVNKSNIVNIVEEKNEVIAKPKDEIVTIQKVEESIPSQVENKNIEEKNEVANEVITHSQPIIESPEIKTEEPIAEKIEAIPEAKVEEAMNEIPVIVETNENIINIEKARKVEALLGGNEDPKIASSVEKKNNESQLVKIQYGIEKPEVESTPIQEIVEEVKVEEPIVEEPIVNRTYDEPNVSDTVKQLKRKFDQVVYRKLPQRKIVTPKVETPTPKKEEPKKEISKTTATKKEVEPKKVEPKNNVKVTKTGVERDLKNTAKKTVDKKVESKKVVDKKATNSKTVDKKTTAKKTSTKESTKSKSTPNKSSKEKTPVKKTTPKKK